MIFTILANYRSYYVEFILDIFLYRIFNRQNGWLGLVIRGPVPDTACEGVMDGGDRGEGAPPDRRRRRFSNGEGARGDTCKAIRERGKIPPSSCLNFHPIPQECKEWHSKLVRVIK